MEDDRERPYSVLTRGEVREMIKKQIDDISGIFLVSRSDATVLLMSFGWDSIRVSERLSENKEKFLAESGLKPAVKSGLKSIVIDLNRDLSDSSCDVFYEFDDNHDGDELISTPICSHKFRTSYWSEYLEESLVSIESRISCPDQDCCVSVGPDTIEKLTVQDRELYEGYVLRSYLGGIKEKMMKECPALGCDYFIEFHRATDLEEHSSNVVCLCGQVFCWSCGLESHVPVTCNNAFDWLSRDLPSLLSNDSASFQWIETNTKPCPHCHCPVEFDSSDFNRFVTCACSGRFCRMCLWSEQSHISGPGFYSACPEPKITLEGREKIDTSCVDRWEACQIATVEAKSNLGAFEESATENPKLSSERDVKDMREGLMLIIQCRQVLKWVCVYEYLQTGYEMAKKEYLRYLQDNASTIVQSYSDTLKEAIEKAFSEVSTSEEGTCFSRKLFAPKCDIGNYFYHFLKTLKDGLVDVKVRSYDNFGGPYWYCDRCTYGSTWFIMKCKMCCDPSAPVEMEE